MLDYWSRLILATIIGVGVGLGISYFFGNPIIWVGLCLAITIATESSLRTISEVKVPPNPVLDNSAKDQTFKKSLPKKSRKPKF